ncbi:MAG: hypothetical protein IJB19_04330 [Clostridia bacterium]|nr:hypothetical protein [Clostridia bacterium]
MGIILRTLHKYFMNPFSYRTCGEFVAEYTRTAAEFDEDPETRDYMIDRCLKDIPCLRREDAWEIVRYFSRRAAAPLDRAIYAWKPYEELFVLNILLILIQLHYDHHWGEKRMTELLKLLKCADTTAPLEWLKTAGVEIAANDNSVYELISKIERKDKPISTAREQLDVRRQLEALKAYQSEVMK